MLKIIPAVMTWGWMFLCVTVSGALSPAVQQPGLVTAVLGRDVIIPCQLSHHQEEKSHRPSVLYWQYATPNNSNHLKVWPNPDQKYQGRVALVDGTERSANKSLVLRSVGWNDGWKYLCKMSISAGNTSLRRRGNQTLLLVHDVMTFNLSRVNESLLVCEVNVTRHVRLALSVSHRGRRLRPIAVAPDDVAWDQPYVTMSQSVSVGGDDGQYECQLHLNAHLITQSVFLTPLVDEVDGDAERNVSLQCPKTFPDPGVEVPPEPWILYTALLLVQITALLGVLTAHITCSC